MITDPVDNAEISVSIVSPIWAIAAPNIADLATAAASAGIHAAYPDQAPIDAGLAVVLSDDASVRDLNRIWRNQDKPTNVLSFPANDFDAEETVRPSFPGVPLELGDVILAAETCRREAIEQGKSLAHHMQHLIIHGVLHLLGYDHLDDSQAERMESLEVTALAGLGIADPYRDDRPSAPPR